MRRPWLTYLLCRLYSHYFKPRLDKAWGMVALSHIHNRGKDCRIHGRITLYYPDRLELGDYVRIGGGGFLFCKGGLQIGTNTQISRNVCIYTANHNINGDTVPYDNQYIYKSVKIGCSVWIGMNTCIKPGVAIGDGAVVAMGTVVSRDVPAGAIIAGQPNRIVAYRDMETFRSKAEGEFLFGRLYADD